MGHIHVFAAARDISALRELEEQRAIAAFIKALENGNIERQVTLEMPLKDLYGRHWSTEKAAGQAGKSRT